MSTKVTILPNGPIKVEGDFVVQDAAGTAIPSTTKGADAYLCRCGQSSKKPFCDGTHSKVGFKAP
jgi:CDGSH-type Zn-finger protein